MLKWDEEWKMAKKWKMFKVKAVLVNESYASFVEQYAKWWRRGGAIKDNRTTIVFLRKSLFVVKFTKCGWEMLFVVVGWWFWQCFFIQQKHTQMIHICTQSRSSWLMTRYSGCIWCFLLRYSFSLWRLHQSLKCLVSTDANKCRRSITPPYNTWWWAIAFFLNDSSSWLCVFCSWLILLTLVVIELGLYGRKKLNNIRASSYPLWSESTFHYNALYNIKPTTFYCCRLIFARTQCVPIEQCSYKGFTWRITTFLPQISPIKVQIPPQNVPIGMWHFLPNCARHKFPKNPPKSGRLSASKVQ